jgi:pimeloyl-ACP methyl ester carboxylesterase
VVRFYSNARDLALLKNFITTQVPRYAQLRTPTVIISGDCDTMVSPDINARALAATLPCAKLVLLKDIGHMPHHAAPEIVAAAIEGLVARPRTRWVNSGLTKDSSVAA